MRKFLTVTIPIVTIALFICIMLSGNILKKSFGENDDIPKYIDDMIRDVNNGDWEKAGNEVEGLKKAWEQVIFRVQFSSERDEINDLTTKIARVRGAIEAQDKANALIELHEAYDHWKELGK